MRNLEKMVAKPMDEADDTGPQGNWGSKIPNSVPEMHPGVIGNKDKPELPAQIPLHIETPPEDWRPFPEELPENKPERGHAEIDYRIRK